MKKLLLIAALLLCAFGIHADNKLTVYTKAGEAVPFHFADKPELKFLGGTMSITVQAGHEPVTFELTEIESIKLEDVTGVEAPTQAAMMAVVTDAAGIHFTGVEDGAQVVVASVDGRVVINTVVNNGEFHLLHGDLAKGVYIIKINKFTTKIIL